MTVGGAGGLIGLDGGHTVSYTEDSSQTGHPRWSDHPGIEVGGLTGPGGGQTARRSHGCPRTVFSRGINTQ
jgi:hypothetical protein